MITLGKTRCPTKFSVGQEVRVAHVDEGVSNPVYMQHLGKTGTVTKILFPTSEADTMFYEVRHKDVCVDLKWMEDELEVVREER